MYRVVDSFVRANAYYVGDVPPEYGAVEALAGGIASNLGEFGVARRPGTDDWYLLTFLDFNEPGLVSSSSSAIGFPLVYGLAAFDDRLYATSFDSTANRTSLLTIDVGTGVGAKIGETSPGVCIVGLAEGEGLLYGCSRPVAGGSGAAVYALDPATGAETRILSIPAVFEGFGGDGAYLVVAGHGLAMVSPSEGVFLPMDVRYFGRTPVSDFVAVSGFLCVTPAQPTSWGRLKSAFSSASK
jgi:hypothetical protein